MMKKTIIIFSIIITLFSIAANAAPIINNCDVKTSCTGGEIAIFSISDYTNAHASTNITEENYLRVCCSGSEISTTNYGDYRTAIALRLEDNTNAHAEDPSLGNYNYPIYISTTDAQSYINCSYYSGSCPAGYTALVSLEQSTNSQIGNKTAYNNNICCKITKDWDLDGYGVCPNCNISNGYTYDGNDCDDDTTDDTAPCPTNPADCDGNPVSELVNCAICINPGANEICDGVDNNCDGFTDNGPSCSCTYEEQQNCGLQQGVCAGSKETCTIIPNGDGVYFGCNTSIYTAWNSSYEETETTFDDGLDNDCDGYTDDQDYDGIINTLDNCPVDFNPDQSDLDMQDGGDVCDPCPYDDMDTCTTPASYTEGANINSSGGSITNPAGEATITIPPGALDNDTSISMSKGGSNFLVQATGRQKEGVSGFVLYEYELTGGKENATFQQPVNLTFYWGNYPNIQLALLNVWYINDEGNMDYADINGKNGKIIDYSAKTITVQVNHFSNFILMEGGYELYIHDSHENMIADAGEPITFYANYTANSTLITGAQCNITFDETPYRPLTMTQSGDQYTYIRYFAYPGLHIWNVTCSKTGYPTLQTWDDVVVEIIPGGYEIPEFSTIGAIAAIAIIGAISFIIIKKH